MDKKKILFNSYLAYKLHEEIYKILALSSKFPEDIRNEIFKNHLCGFDTAGLLLDTFVEYYPERFEKDKSINDNIKIVEQIIREVKYG